jgi:hypothetical protein
MEVPVKKYILSSIAVLLLLTACGSDSDEIPTEEVEPPVTEPAPALSTIEFTATEPGYPGPTSPDSYPGPVDDPGYPGPPPATPEPASYPAGTVFWMLHPAGMQCEDPLIYPELEDAVAALEDNEVIVSSSEEVELLVCAACGCPTSKYYRVQIDADDLIAATALGWVRE